jgi:hypothetical protein
MILRRPLTPLAVLASACTLPPLGPVSPSEVVAQQPQTPEMHGVDLPSRTDALRRWQLAPSDPWAVYAKYTLLTALSEAPRRDELPDVGALDEVQRAWAAGKRAGAAALPSDTLWIVDLRGAASVTFGLALSHGAAGQAVSLVPTFNNWPAPNELVPAEETLAALAAAWPRQPEDGAVETVPVFLLDAWRLAYRFDDPGDETYDNRYALSTTDLPDLDALHAHGIRRVVYVVESLGRTTVEEDDLHDTFLAWSEAGIGIAMLDLDSLSDPMVGARWDALLATNALVVGPRPTILEDPAFYARAHGGFGGGHAGFWPGSVHVGGGHGWGHGYGTGHGSGHGFGGFGGGHHGFGGGRGGRGG